MPGPQLQLSPAWEDGGAPRISEQEEGRLVGG